MRKPLSLLFGAVILSTLAGCLVSMPATNPRPQWDQDLLVTTRELAGRLNDSRTAIVHVGRDRATYDAGHVPGARFLPLSSIMADVDGMPNELLPPEQLEEAFEAVGVGDNSRVVLYGDLEGLAAARAFFTLDYLGKRDAALLDGGLERWRMENRPVETVAPEPTRGALTVRLQPDVLADAEFIRANLGNDSTIVLVDARPAAQFAEGHIPGAHSIFWRDALVSDTDLRLRSPQVLAAAYTLAEADQDDTVVVYCRSGLQAAHAYFVARYLEREARLYDGSFLDWSQRGAEYPVETGS